MIKDNFFLLVKFSDNVEYETLTVTVPESLAEKLLSEARTAGALKPYKQKNESNKSI